MTHTARIHADDYECGELQGVRFVRVGCAHRLPRSAVEHCTALDATERFSVSAEPPHPSSVSLHDQFWAKVDCRGPDECWPWTGALLKTGYGSVGRHTRAHRVALALTGVPVPADRMVLHSCDNPPCCNPAHLRVGTGSDNALDMYARGRRVQEHKTHCKWGHPFTGQNLVIETNTGRHRCRTCLVTRRRAQSERDALRASSAVGSTTVPSAPLPGIGSLDPTADVRELVRASQASPQ